MRRYAIHIGAFRSKYKILITLSLNWKLLGKRRKYSKPLNKTEINPNPEAFTYY